MKWTRRQVITRGTIAAVGLSGLDAFLVEPRCLVFNEVEIPIHGLKSELDGYRIALLSDIHYPLKAKKDLVQAACRMAMKFRPHVIALPGDFVHSRVSGVPSFAGVYDQLDAPDGVWATLGNHDHWVDEKAVRRELATNTPIGMIEHRNIVVRRGNAKLAIGGTGDLWCGFVNPDKTFAGVPADVPRILLSHNPDLAEDLKDKVRIDLQLSGHTHGGEVRVPFGPAPVVPSKYGNKFRAGLCEGKRHRVYVTRGVCTVAARFFCPPEVTGIILRAT